MGARLRLRHILPACAALAVAGCGGSDESAPSATPTAAVSAADELGKTYTFARVSGGTEVGSIRFTDAATLPESCVIGSPSTGGTVVAARVELVNATTTKLEPPSSLGLLKVNDTEGFTHDTDGVTIAQDCRSQFPTLSTPPAPGKAAGWFAVRSQVPPSALVFTASAWDGVITADSIPFVPVTPATVIVKLPALTPPATPASTPVPTAAPTTTEPPAPPPPTVVAPVSPRAGGSCNPDTQNWAKDASGQQLYCGYAGGSTAKWIESLPLIGTRQVGTPCDSYDYVAKAPDGRPLVCSWDPVRQDGSNSWQPGP